MNVTSLFMIWRHICQGHSWGFTDRKSMVLLYPWRPSGQPTSDHGFNQ